MGEGGSGCGKWGGGGFGARDWFFRCLSARKKGGGGFSVRCILVPTRVDIRWRWSEWSEWSG